MGKQKNTREGRGRVMEGKVESFVRGPVPPPNIQLDVHLRDNVFFPPYILQNQS